MKNIVLVTFHDARAQGGEADDTSVFTDKKTGVFRVVSASHNLLVPTLWWASQGKVHEYSLQGADLMDTLLQAERRGPWMGAATWYSPHAFSVLQRVLYWEALESRRADDYKYLTRGGVVDIVDVFNTPDNVRNTLTREERTRSSVRDMAFVLPSLAGTGWFKPLHEAEFLLRLAYAAANMIIDF